MITIDLINLTVVESITNCARELRRPHSGWWEQFESTDHHPSWLLTDWSDVGSLTNITNPPTHATFIVMTNVCTSPPDSGPHTIGMSNMHLRSSSISWSSIDLRNLLSLTSSPSYNLTARRKSTIDRDHKSSKRIIAGSKLVKKKYSIRLLRTFNHPSITPSPH